MLNFSKYDQNSSNAWSRPGNSFVSILPARYGSSDDVDRDEGSEELLGYIWSILNCLTDTNAITGIGGMLGGSDGLEVATRIWLEEWSPIGNTHAAKILRESFESVTVSDSSVEPNEVRAVKRRLLLSTAMSSINFNYIADDVIRLALSRIRRSDVGDLVVHFEVVMFVMGGVTTKFASEFLDLQRAFVRHRGVSIALNCLRKVLKKIHFDLEAPDASLMAADDIEALSQCLQALLLGLNTSQSNAPLKRALGRNLMWLFASCSTQCIYSRLQREDQGIIGEILKDVIENTLVIRSVLLAARRGISNYLRTSGRTISTTLTLLEVFPSLARSTVHLS